MEVEFGDFNLFFESDEDIETFRDIITDNVFIESELLKKGEKKSFGNMCILEAVNNIKEVSKIKLKRKIIEEKEVLN